MGWSFLWRKYRKCCQNWFALQHYVHCNNNINIFFYNGKLVHKCTRGTHRVADYDISWLEKRDSSWPEILNLSRPKISGHDKTTKLLPQLFTCGRSWYLWWIIINLAICIHESYMYLQIMQKKINTNALHIFIYFLCVCHKHFFLFRV